jgi:hypothetical protein
MKIITICGSFKFTYEMIKECERLSLEGNCVLTPVYPTYEHLYRDYNELDTLRSIHNKKIRMSDAIYVLDKDGYIGENTRAEIEYAKNLNKEIIYYSKSKGE